MAFRNKRTYEDLEGEVGRMIYESLRNPKHHKTCRKM